MKRQGNLYSKVWAFENLYRAYRKARREKRYRPDVLRFTFSLEEELLILEDELKNRRYRPGKYRSFIVRDPKPRRIKAPPFRDRVVHHALCNVIEPIFDRSFIYDSYACRKGKGTHQALGRLTEYLRKVNRNSRQMKGERKRARWYCLQGDIKKYFASVDHEAMLGTVRRKIKDPDILWLVGTIISSHADDCFFDDRRQALRWTGIPIGSLTSQLFANIYLDRLDHFIKEELKARYYLRYMDDFIILDFSTDRLNEHKKEIARFLRERLLLNLNENKTTIFPADHGIDFLGYRVWHDHRKLRRDNVRRFKRRLKSMEKKYLEGKITLPEVETAVGSWIAHALHADTYRLRRKLFACAPSGEER